MISMELSTVQYNGLQSAILTTQIDEFLRRGGAITTAPELKPVPLPYGRLKPVDKSTKLVRENLKKKPPWPSRAHSQELIERIATMSETMTCAHIAEETGLTYNQVKCLGMRNGFTFKRAESTGRTLHASATEDPAIDQKLAERINAFKDLGISRNKCHQTIGIGAERFNRILDDFQIDYPRSKGGRTARVSS